MNEDQILLIARRLVETARLIVQSIAAMMPPPLAFALRAVVAFFEWLLQEHDRQGGSEPAVS